MKKKRYNIGLLVASLVDNYSNLVAVGAMEAAKKLDANLLIFPGKNVDVQHINELYRTEYEYQHNVLFDFAAQAKLDYLIVVAGAILYAHPRETHKAFMDGLGNTPILCVASEVEGYDFLQYDNRSGITQAVNYLATHGRKHIGMIAGELHNHEFEQRYEAYRAALASNGLEFKESYMTPCSLAMPCYKEAGQLLDANPELDAIVCANDIIAINTCEVLKQRNIRIGIDMAVVGFDDLPIDTRLDPPVASVRANASELGASAVEKAVNLLNGVKDDRHYLDAQFIPRRSCFKYVDDYNIPEKVFFGNFSEMLGHINAFFAERRINAAADEKSYDLIMDFLEHLYKNYMEQVVDETVVHKTLLLLDRCTPLKEDSEINWIFHGTYIWFLRNCPVDNIAYIQMLHQYFRADNHGETARALSKKFEDRTHNDNLFIRDALMFSGNLGDSYARILGRAQGIGAQSAFLYTFEQPFTHSYGDKLPEELTWVFRSYSYSREVFSLPKDTKMSTPEVFSNEYLSPDRQHILIAADLFSAQTQYGVALLEPRDEEFFDELEMVTYQLSSAVRTLDMLKNQEQLLSELHTTNLALEKKSKIDEMTGVYNRRGFFPAANQLISDAAYRGGEFIVCFADMDDLKVVNDTYGHQEGDFAIKLLAKIMTEIFGESAVVGRMGGDEFAAIVPVALGGSAQDVRARAAAFIQSFNEAKEKPYRFSTSMGLLQSMCENSYDLSEALQKADDLLYIEKKQKKAK